MSEFKLLAIRPLEGCDGSYSKNLTKGEIYKFYNDYVFLDKNKKPIIDLNTEVFEIKKNEKHSSPSNLYNIKTINGNEIEVNITAIVGKNGSGKSSLLELIYALCFLLSKKQGKNIEALKGKLELDLWFSNNGKFFELSINENNRIALKSFGLRKAVERFKFQDFFYNIVINYSHYSLNSTFASWLVQLFEKVDSYQIPIVLNPYRKDGNININSEQHLAQSRLLLNMANIKDDSNIINNKKLDKIIFEINLKPKSYYTEINIDNNFYFESFDVFLDIFNTISKKIVEYEINQKKEITKLKKIFVEYIENNNNFYLKSNLNKNGENGEIIDYSYIKFQFIMYVIKKLIKICINYKNKEFLKIDESSSKIRPLKVLEFENLDKLLNEIKKDKSHVTLKLRQALNTIKFGLFESSNPRVLIYNNEAILYRIEIDKKNYDKKIKSLLSNSNKIEDKIEFIPGALVKPTIILNNKCTYGALSSGEIQILNILNVVNYHLRNLDSVTSSNIQYKSINIILDEVELYFHPEFQRTLITEMLNGISNMNLNQIKNINIMFSTHSPFILSDIPNQNILKLEDGKPISFKETEKTFGANIHDLLANDFFLNDGFMGEYAKDKIEEIVRFINYHDLKNRIERETDIDIKAGLEKEMSNLKDLVNFNINKSYIEQVIGIIGEPLIKYKLLEMYENAFQVNNKKIDIISKIKNLMNENNINKNEI